MIIKLIVPRSNSEDIVRLVKFEFKVHLRVNWTIVYFIFSSNAWRPFYWIIFWISRGQSFDHFLQKLAIGQKSFFIGSASNVSASKCVLLPPLSLSLHLSLSLSPTPTLYHTWTHTLSLSHTHSFSQSIPLSSLSLSPQTESHAQISPLEKNVQLLWQFLMDWIHRGLRRCCPSRRCCHSCPYCPFFCPLNLGQRLNFHFCLNSF